MPTHLFLLGLIFLLHLPIFNPQYFLSTESLIFLSTQQLANTSGTLYLDAWLGRPPLIIWIYRGFYSLFHEDTLFVLRVLRCLYVYVCVVFISGFINSLRVQDRYSWIIPISMAALLSTPWYALESSLTLFSLLPISFTFISLLKLESSPRKNVNLRAMFWVGVWTLFFILLSYKTLPLFFGLLLGYLILRTFRLEEFFALLGGMLVLFGGVCLILFFSESLSAFFDQGIIFPWDRITGDKANSLYRPQLPWFSLLINWGPWILLAAFGFIHYRIRFYSYVAKVRLIERLMSIWLFFGLAGILMKGRAIENHDFILIAPSLSFYGTKVFDLISRRYWRWLATGMATLPPLMVFLAFWFPQGFSVPLLPTDSFFRGITARSPVEVQEEQESYYRYLSKLSQKDEVWILADWSDLYLRLGLVPPYKYLDFAMLEQKSLCWNPDKFLLSKKEPERDFFLHISDHPPQWIVDPNDLFPQLQVCYPSLFSTYDLVSDKEVLIYQRNP